MKPTFIQEAETVWDTRTTPKTTALFPVLAGDVLVAYSVTEGYDIESLTSPTISDSSGSLIWILQQRIVITDYTQVLIWTAIVDTNKNMSVSFSLVPGTSPTYGFYGGNVLTFRGSSGVGNTAQAYASGPPTLNIPTTQNNSAIVVVNADWDALIGTARAYLTNAGAFNETTYNYILSRYTVFAGYHDDAGIIGTKTLGLTAPTPQKYSIAAVEVKGIDLVGAISGNVRSVLGFYISGATVSDGTRSAVTDSSGNYTITNVPPGTYSVIASATGYISGMISGVPVTAGATTAGLQFTLNPTCPTLACNLTMVT